MATLLQPFEWRPKGGSIPRMNRRASVSLPAFIRLFGTAAPGTEGPGR